MNGSRRARVTPVLPRYTAPCLFTGHLSTKSNAFCTDSSSLRLTTLQLVKNHMAVHYNKILSAKAAVDCSIPVSMTTSIKYSDQQRREKLKKEFAQFEKEFKLTKSPVNANSKMNSKSFFNTLQKPSGESREETVSLEDVSAFPSYSKSLVTPLNSPRLGLSRSDKVLTSGSENSSASSCSLDYKESGPRNPSSGSTCDRRSRGTFPNAHRFQLVISKTPNGDLLEKHSDLFSNKQLPFTPRTLKTEAKSFLSQYRYYTPAKRRKDFTDQRMEAETQTELSSFNSDFWTAETKNLTTSEVNTQQAPNYVISDTEEKISSLPLKEQKLSCDKIKDDTLQKSPERTLCPVSTQLSPDSKAFTGLNSNLDVLCCGCSEEELLYLNFIENVTDEILKLGLFSNRFLERLFERHIKQNKHHLEEEKMRFLLHSLKVDLGCTPEDDPEKLSNISMLNLLDFQKALKSGMNDSDLVAKQERQQYQKALDMLLSAPRDDELFSSNDFYLPVHKSKSLEGVSIQQVNDDTDGQPSAWDENHPSISDNFIDQETSVDVIEGDSDTEKADSPGQLCCLSTSLSPSATLSIDQDDSNYGKKLATLKIKGDEH